MNGWMHAVVNSSAGAGGNEYAELTPPLGAEYEIIECTGYHDDNAAARDTYWAFYDSQSNYYRSTVNIAQLLRQDFMSTVTGTSVIGNSNKGTSFILRYGQYVRFYVNALGAGKKAYINAMVVKRRGVTRGAAYTA